jgi:hypothetical protein
MTLKPRLIIKSDAFQMACQAGAQMSMEETITLAHAPG